MRLALVSMIALSAAAASAFAQPTSSTTPATTDTPPPATSAPAAPEAAPAPATPAAPAAATPAPAEPAVPAAAPVTPAPAAPATETPPASTAAPTPPAPVAEAPPPPAPPEPPPPPTDPTAISVLSVLQSVCIPAAAGGNLANLAKAAGYRKSGDTWQLRQRDFTLTIQDPGSNPNQCHVDITHTADQEAPGRQIVVALHNWAAFANGWSLYRNDKNVAGASQYTTRSWQKDADGKLQSLVFLTIRHADGTPMKGGTDTSQLIYGITAGTPPAA